MTNEKRFLEAVNKLVDGDVLFGNDVELKVRNLSMLASMISTRLSELTESNIKNCKERCPFCEEKNKEIERLNKELDNLNYEMAEMDCY